MAVPVCTHMWLTHASTLLSTHLGLAKPQISMAVRPRTLYAWASSFEKLKVTVLPSLVESQVPSECLTRGSLPRCSCC